MASLTETLGAQANPTVDISGDIQAGLKTGIQLATAKEDVEKKKSDLEAQQLIISEGKFKAFDGMMKTMNRMNPTIAKQSAPKLKQQFQAYGFDPAIVDTVISDPDFGRQWQNFSDVASGKVLANPEALGGILQRFQDAGMLAEGLDLYKNAQSKAQQDKQSSQQNSQFYAGLKNQKDIAMMNNETKEKVKSSSGGGLTVGEKARDTKFAKDYSGFFDSGGAAGVEANLSSLENSLEALEKGKTSKYSGLLGETVQNFVDPDSANVKTDVTQVLIQGLKDTFGGQLSDGERIAMVKSVYVDSADPKANAKRVRALADKIKSGAKAKEMAGQYFEENGTLKGFKGTTSFDIGGKTVKFNPGGDSASVAKTSVGSAPVAVPSVGGLTPSLQAALDKVLAKVPPEKHAAATAQFMQRVQQTTAKGN